MNGVREFGRVPPSKMLPLALLLLSLIPCFVHAQNPQSCGGEVTVQLSAPRASQGGLLLLELRSRAPMSQLTAEWESKSVPFWKPDAPPPTSPDLRRALLGADLELSPGDHPLLIRVQTVGQEPQTCTIHIPVLKG